MELFPRTQPRGAERPLRAISRVTATNQVSNDNFDGHPPHQVNLLHR
ncbi:hypothetical protein, partial [Nocardia wallacei]